MFYRLPIEVGPLASWLSWIGWIVALILIKFVENVSTARLLKMEWEKTTVANCSTRNEYNNWSTGIQLLYENYLIQILTVIQRILQIVD